MFRRNDPYEQSQTRREASPSNLDEAVEAQYMRRAARYENLDYISQKYEKYLSTNGNPKGFAVPTDAEIAPLDYRA